MSQNIAIIFAGGSGARMGSGLPKQFLEVGGKPVIIHTLNIFEEHDEIDRIYIACKADYIPRLKRLIDRYRTWQDERIVRRFDRFVVLTHEDASLVLEVLHIIAVIVPIEDALALFLNGRH